MHYPEGTPDPNPMEEADRSAEKDMFTKLLYTPLMACSINIQSTTRVNVWGRLLGTLCVLIELTYIYKGIRLTQSSGGNREVRRCQITISALRR